MTWPYPGEAPLVRARRVAQAYRAALENANQEACDLIDARLMAWGETWVVPRLITWGPDDMITSAEAADVLCTSPGGVSTLRRRGRIDGIRQPDGSYRYRAADVARLSTGVRRRTRHTTDTLTDDGRTAPS
jgi:hypothetical protein